MYVFDMDGTLANCDHRLHFIKGEGKKNWKGFYAGMRYDEEIEPIARLCRHLLMLSKDVRVVTGRPENTRYDTLEWLKAHRIHIRPYRVYMRKEGDYREDFKVKEEIVKPFMDQIQVIFDDRQQVVDMYRSLGLVVCQVAKGDY